MATSTLAALSNDLADLTAAGAASVVQVSGARRRPRHRARRRHHHHDRTGDRREDGLQVRLPETPPSMRTWSAGIPRAGSRCCGPRAAQSGPSRGVQRGRASRAGRARAGPVLEQRHHRQRRHRRRRRRAAAHRAPASAGAGDPHHRAAPRRLCRRRGVRRVGNTARHRHRCAGSPATRWSSPPRSRGHRQHSFSSPGRRAAASSASRCRRSKVPRRSAPPGREGVSLSGSPPLARRSGSASTSAT